MRRPSTISTNEASNLLIRVLVVEPDGPSQVARTLLAHAGRGRVVVAHAVGVPEALAKLAEQAVASVVHDHGLPCRPVDGLARLWSAALDAPVFGLCGHDQADP